MKALYLAGSIIFSALILVLAFENFSAQCSNMNFFFYSVQSNPTIVILAVALTGMITGALYHAFIGQVLGKTSDEEEEDF